jgi:hypothetical protein
MNSTSPDPTGFRIRRPLRSTLPHVAALLLTAVACVMARGPVALLPATDRPTVLAGLMIAALAAAGAAMVMLALTPLHRIVITNEAVAFGSPWGAQAVTRASIAKLAFQTGAGFRLTDRDTRQIAVIPDWGWTRKQRELLSAALGCPSSGIWPPPTNA